MKIWITVIEFAVVEFERLYKTKVQSDAINPSHNETDVCFDCSDGSRTVVVVS